MSAKEHYEAGNLAAAIEDAVAEVKSDPAATGKRTFLCELLCFSGDFERADKQLDALSIQEPDAMMAVSLFRQLLRAEQARQQFFSEGRVPEFVDGPTEVQKLQLEASICLREGDTDKAATLLAQAEEQRPEHSGSCDDAPFNDFRDLDDLIAGSLEVLTPNGKYYWIPMERLESLEFRTPEYARDLVWRGAQMVIRDGDEGEVFVPALYAATPQHADDKLRLGRATDWVGDEGQPIRGIGQRTFLVGEADQPIMTLNRIKVDAPAN